MVLTLAMLLPTTCIQVWATFNPERPVYNALVNAIRFSVASAIPSAPPAGINLLDSFSLREKDANFTTVRAAQAQLATGGVVVAAVPEAGAGATAVTFDSGKLDPLSNCSVTVFPVTCSEFTTPLTG